MAEISICVKHQVKHGDTLSQIAVGNATTVANIMDENPFIQHPDRIFQGFVIAVRHEVITEANIKQGNLGADDAAHKNILGQK